MNQKKIVEVDTINLDHNMPKQIKDKEEETSRISIKKNPDKIPSSEVAKPHSASMKRE
jgi:hypothetical protein